MKIFYLFFRWALIGVTFLSLLYRILCLWHPPLPYLSPEPLLFNYVGIPKSDLLFPPTLAINLVHQHGSIHNWLLPPAPYLFPDLILLMIVACFIHNIWGILLAYGLLQIGYFTSIGYLMVRLLTKSAEASHLTLLFLLGGLWIVGHPEQFKTFGTLTTLLAPMMHFSITNIMLTLLCVLPPLLYPPNTTGQLRKSVANLLLISFSLLFLLTAISDPILLSHFAAPLIIALLINRAPTSSKPYGYLYLVGMVGLAWIAWKIYQILPLNINHLKNNFQLNYENWFNLWGLLVAFAHHAPQLTLLWGLFMIGGALSWLTTRLKSTTQHNPIDFILSIIWIQTLIVILTMIIMNRIPALHHRAIIKDYPIRYLQPAITLACLIGLPLLLYKHCRTLPHWRIRRAMLYTLILFLLCLSSLYPFPICHLSTALSPYPPMIACLDQQARARHLRQGLSGYYDYYLINQTNRSGLTVVNTMVGPHALHKNYMNSPIDEGQHQTFTFVVTTPPINAPRKKGQAEWLSPQNVQKLIGPPDQQFNCPPFSVLVYQHGQINRVFRRHD